MTMNRAIRISLWVGIAALSLGTWAVAQTSVTLTGVQGTSYDGIYVSPYYATVNGVPNTPVVCDDFGDESTLGSTWNAGTTAFGGISSTNTAWGKEGANLALYNSVAYLTLQVLQQMPGSSSQILDTYALWAVFDPSGVEGYLAAHPITGPSGTLTTATLCDEIFGTSNGCTSSTAASGGSLYTVENSTYTAGEFSGLEVISPDVSGTSTLCTAESTGTTACPAQEFVAIVPEGGSALAYLFLAGLCCFGAIGMRSRRQIGSTTSVA
jgi:hypothetical protein